MTSDPDGSSGDSRGNNPKNPFRGKLEDMIDAIIKESPEHSVKDSFNHSEGHPVNSVCDYKQAERKATIKEACNSLKSEYSN